MAYIHTLLGHSWGEVLKPYISEQFLDDLGEKIATERDTAEVYPERRDIFRAFQETPFEKVKVVLCAQDPYHTPMQATGLAFDCGLKISPTMEKVLGVYKEDYPGGFAGPLEEGRCSHWAKEGVFLYNTALTVRKGQPQSHSKMWLKFSGVVIDTLKASKFSKAFMILGTDARSLIGKLPDHHGSFIYEHPMAAQYSNRMWNAKGIFLKVNQFLTDNGETKIDW